MVFILKGAFKLQFYWQNKSFTVLLPVETCFNTYTENDDEMSPQWTLLTGNHFTGSC